MLISDVLSHAKARFPVLLTDDAQVQAYLVQALTCYQDLAGCIRTLKHDAPAPGGHKLPDVYLAHGATFDANGDFVAVSVDETDEGPVLHAEEDVTYPLSTEYFVHLADYANHPGKHIPNRIAGMVINYLECLIAMDNDDRIARVEGASKMDNSRTPTRLDRTTQKEALEEQFRANRAIISMISLHPR